MDFRILGPLEASDEGRVLALGGTKQRAVLALLLLHPNERLSAERLIDELWGEQAPPAAAKSLQMHVGRLRKALGRDGVLETQGSGYRVRVEPGDLDLSRFERLAADGRRSLAAAIPRRRPPAQRGAGRVARPGARRPGDRAVRPARGRPPGGAAPGGDRGPTSTPSSGSAGTRELAAELEPLVAEHPFRERLRAS